MREALTRKHHRQQALLRAVNRQRLATQADLVRSLRAAGFDATQATVSRDIVELGLVKVARDGMHAYAPPSAAAPGGGQERLRRFCEDYPVEGALAANLVVLRRTLSPRPSTRRVSTRSSERWPVTTPSSSRRRPSGTRAPSSASSPRSA